MNLLKRLHQEEEGLETLQVVMIIAVAAIVLAVVKKIWDNNIKQWVAGTIQNIAGIQINF